MTLVTRCPFLYGFFTVSSALGVDLGIFWLEGSRLAHTFPTHPFPSSLGATQEEEAS